MSNPYEGESSDPKTPAITGKFAFPSVHPAIGVGVLGASAPGYGVVGYVVFDFAKPVPLPGEPGFPQAPGGQAGVYGFCNAASGSGVFGLSTQFDGVHGESQSNQHAGVSGINNSGGQAGKGGPGVYGSSSNMDGIQGWSQSSLNAAVSATNTGGGFGVWARAKTAGYFDGDVEVTGDFTLNGGDCAEHFDVVDAARCEPGTVMAIDDSGALVLSCREYDRRVAGVVSGAGGLRPSLFLDQKPDSGGRLPIALVGKVCCKAVAQGGPIAVGDLLTTSALPGHAMKASDPSRAFGAVIGKALEPLPSGVGLIRVLIALQ
jgi:hypothetical protein